MQRSIVLSDHLNYNILKGYQGILLNDTKNKLPTSALVDTFLTPVMAKLNAMIGMQTCSLCQFKLGEV